MHPGSPITLPPKLATTLAHAGDDERRWAESLPSLATDTAATWQLTLGEPFDEGSWSLVIPALRADGTDAVLKLVRPGPHAARQIEVEKIVDGRGLVRLLDADVERGAMLLERLQPATTQTLTEATRNIATALQEFWPAAAPLVSRPSEHDRKASGLLAFVDEIGATAPPEHRPAVAECRRLAVIRQRAAQAGPLVFCHGDPHPGNLMQRADGTAVLVDVDGFSCEPEYDLGVALRGWTSEVLSSDDPKTMINTAADDLAHRTGTDPEAVRQWAYIERVTSGLYLRTLGHLDDGKDYLDSAVRLL